MAINRNLSIIGALVFGAGFALLWSQQTWQCRGICPTNVGSGTCMPTLDAYSENYDCIYATPDDNDPMAIIPLCKNGFYRFTWPGSTQDDLLEASESGQFTKYYPDFSCNRGLCIWGPVLTGVPCWPSFDNPLQYDGLFEVNTYPATCAWNAGNPMGCQFCTDLRRYQVTCQKGFRNPHRQPHTCTCD